MKNLIRSEAYYRRKIIKQYNLSAEQIATLDEEIAQKGYTYKEVNRLLEKTLPLLMEAAAAFINAVAVVVKAAAQVFNDLAAALSEYNALQSAEKQPKHHRQKCNYKATAAMRNYKAPLHRFQHKPQHKG